MKIEDLRLKIKTLYWKGNLLRIFPLDCNGTVQHRSVIVKTNIGTMVLASFKQ